jgi:hypothetical protein
MQDIKQNGQHTLKILQHIIIPEPQYDEAVVRKPDIAFAVALRFCVLAAIDFDHNAPLEAYEICDEAAHRHLPAKLEIGKSPITQSEPELEFRIGHALAERAGAGNLC